MGAILLGSAGSVPENDESTNSIPLPDSTPTDPVVLTEGIGIGVPDHGMHIPAGGLTDQVLTKLSDDDYSMAWVDPAGGGGSYTFENFLTESAGTVKLGGVSTQEYTYLTVSEGAGDTEANNLVIRYDDDSNSGRFSMGYDTGFNLQSYNSGGYTGKYSILELTGGDAYFSIQGTTNSAYIKMDQSTGLEIGDNIWSKGFVYLADYSGNFTARSIVDKAYVDAAAIGDFAFQNGLTNTAGVVKLGGALTGTTNIDIEDNEFSIYFDDGSYSGKIEIGDTTFSITAWDEELYAGNRFAIHLLGSITLVAHGGVSDIKLEISETFFEITDNVNSKGVVYVADYSANFTDHSLVTKKWVTDNFAAI